MRYGSVCSGIEAATMAWHALGWQPAFFSEIEAFPRAVLEHRYPAVPLHGDFTTIEENQYGKIDLLVGGTPCQSFSVAGLRGGLDDERGNLALEFCRLAQRERPRWIVWENVPGVLSSNGGRDFGSILGALAELGYGLAYRVLDAQYFGVAQRRRRVFVVGYLGDWRRAAAVLFERHSLSGHPAPRREAREDAPSGPASGADSGGGSGRERLAVDWPAAVANTLDTDFAAKWGQNNQHVNAGCPLFVPDTVGTLSCNTGPNGNDAGNFACNQAVDAGHVLPVHVETVGTLRNPPAIAIQERAICENPNAGPDGIGVRTDDAAYTLEARTVPQAVGYRTTGNDGAYETGDKIGALAAQPGTKQTTYVAVGSREVAGALTANYGKQPDSSDTSLGPNLAITTTGVFYGGQGAKAGSIAYSNEISPTLKAGDSGTNRSPSAHIGSAVRRLTPVECERLQGFPDGFTAIPWRKKDAADCPDGPRYKALGNSMAVPVMRWIGERIQMIEDLTDVL